MDSEIFGMFKNARYLFDNQLTGIFGNANQFYKINTFDTLPINPCKIRLAWIYDV